MNCETYRNDIALSLYGELTDEESSRLDAHLASCPGCRAELERVKAVNLLLDSRAIEPPPSMAVELRRDLMTSIEHGGGRGWIRSVLFGPALAAGHPVLGLRRIAAGIALVAVGFFAARLSTRTQGVITGGPAFPSDGVVSSVHPDPSGKVTVSIDATETHEITGDVDDDKIRTLLLKAARDAANPGLRVESIGILKDHGDSEPVKRVLLRALATDPNDGVRLQALEGLKRLGEDAETRRVLVRTLTNDTNPGVRVQVIEILTRDPDDSLVGVFQGAVHNEQNRYVRMQCIRALRNMNASVGTF